MMNSFIGDFADKLKKHSKPQYTESSIFPVLDAKNLIVKSERMKYEKKINELVRIPPEHFNPLYSDLITNFINFVQVLPMRYGDPLGSILQQGLRHGYFALKLLMDTSAKNPDPLYTYAVFSMALLMDSVRVFRTQKAMISDGDGTFLREWCPFNGSLIDQNAEHYKLREYANRGEAVLRSANPILAESLMPETGMAWIASDGLILDMWLACLSGHDDWAGTLGHLKKLLKKFIDEKKASEDRIGMVDMDILIEQPEKDPGEEFLKWLKDGLEDESISVNKEDSKVQILEEGVFIDDSLFEDFTRVFSEYRDWQVVQAHFNHLGITKLSGYHFKVDQYFSERPEVAGRRAGFLSHAHERAADAAQKAKAEGKMQTQQFKSQATGAAGQITRQGNIVDKKVLFIQGTPPKNSQTYKMAITTAAAQAIMTQTLEQLSGRQANHSPGMSDR